MYSRKSVGPRIEPWGTPALTGYLLRTGVKKTKRLTHEEVKKQLIESMVVNEVVETNELNKQAEEVQDLEEAAKVIQKYENIIRTKKKGIINIAFHQGKVFKKFKDKEKVITLVNKLGIHKTTIIFKINIYKLCKKHPKLLKSSIVLGFLKSYYKDIKEICNENEQEFS